jgi:transposase-like protein
MGAGRRKIASRRVGIGVLRRLESELGRAEVARRVGVGEATLERWARRGVSASGTAALREVEGRRQAAKRAAETRAATPAGRARAREALEARRRLELAEQKAQEAVRKAEAEKEIERQTRAWASSFRAREERLREDARQKAREAQRAARKERQEELRRAREAAKVTAKKAELARSREARKKALEEARRRAREAREQEALSKKERREAEARKKREKKEAEARARAEAEAKRREKLAEDDQRIKILEEAVRLLDGSQRALAEVAQVNEATIRRWLRHPPRKSEAFDRVKFMVEELHTFLELMKLAGEVGALPRVKPGAGVRSGRKTEGVWWTRLVMRRLTPAIIREIVSWVESRPGRFFPYWQVVLMTSQFARPGTSLDDTSAKISDKRYETVVLQLGHQRWGDFAVFRRESSAESRSAGAAARDMGRRMRTKIDGGVHVFVHGVTVFAYSRRSKASERAWARAQKGDG